jgi:hypothetical protein
MVTMRSCSLRAVLRCSPLWCLPLIAIVSFIVPCSLAASDPPPAKDATSYPAVDVHSKEQVAIAAEPFDTSEKCKIFQVDYLKYRFLPIRIIVTNTGDQPISLRDARIFFISAQGDKIPAADPEDVERRVKPKDSRGRDIPVGPIKVHTKGSAPHHACRLPLLRHAGPRRYSPPRRKTGSARTAQLQRQRALFF